MEQPVRRPLTADTYSVPASGEADAHVQAARAASTAAASAPPAEQAGGQDEERELPAFGRGLEFRPQGKLAASKGGAAAADAVAPANDGSLAISLEEETVGAEEDDMGDDSQVEPLGMPSRMDACLYLLIYCVQDVGVPSVLHRALTSSLQPLF